MIMNEKIKKIFSYIVAFFSGVVAIVGYYIFRDRGTVESDTDGVQRAEESNREAEQSVDRAGESVDRATDTASRIERGIEESKDTASRIEQSFTRIEEIIEKIRSQELD